MLLDWHILHSVHPLVSPVPVSWIRVVSLIRRRFLCEPRAAGSIVCCHLTPFHGSLISCWNQSETYFGRTIDKSCMRNCGIIAVLVKI